MKSEVHPGMLQIKVPQTQRDTNHLPKIIDEMRDRKKYNFSEHQISVNLQLHLFEKNKENPSTTMCKSFADTFEVVHGEKKVMTTAWNNSNSIDRGTTVKIDKETEQPIRLADVNRKNKNMRAMCSDLTLKMYNEMVKERGQQTIGYFT